jgi:hypothetical protein
LTLKNLIGALNITHESGTSVTPGYVYLIPQCLRGEVNNTPTLPPVVHMVVTLCTTCSKNIKPAMELIFLYILIPYTFITSL